MKTEINLLLYKQDGIVHICSDDIGVDIEGETVRDTCERFIAQMEEDWDVFRETGYIPPVCNQELFKKIYKSLFQGDKVFG